MFRMLRLKPPHGWHAVVWELAIVTAGVLIALGVQQWAESRSWQAKVERARLQLKQEAFANHFNLAERMAVAPCVDAQIDELLKRANAPGDRLEPAEAITSGNGRSAIRNPSRPHYTKAWQGIIADGVPSRFPEEERALIAQSYESIELLSTLRENSEALMGRVNSFLVPLSLDPSVRADLVSALLALRRTNDLQALASAQIMAAQTALALHPEPKVIDRQLALPGLTTEFCSKRGLPLADWHRKLADMQAEARSDPDDLSTIYLKSKQNR